MQIGRYNYLIISGLNFTPPHSFFKALILSVLCGGVLKNKGLINWVLSMFVSNFAIELRANIILTDKTYFSYETF